MQVTAVHEDLAGWAGSSWKISGCILERACTLSRMLGTPGPGDGLLGVRGGQGDLGTQHLEDAGKYGALILSHSLAIPEMPQILVSQMRITGRGRDVCCHTTGQPPQLPVPMTDCVFPTRYTVPGTWHASS